MIRQGFLTGLLILALVLPASARIGQGPSTGSGDPGPGNFGTNCTGKYSIMYDLQRQGPALVGATTLTTGTTAGIYNCHSFRMACNATNWTQMGFQVTTGLASSVAEVGIYTLDGATRIASTGPQSSAAGASVSAMITAFSLVAGTQYLACWASSAAVTVAYRIPGTPSSFNNLFENSTFNSGVLATQVAPFNAACIGAANPYTCCSGAGTGTCNGMADRTGVPGFTTGSIMGPLIQVAP